MLITVMTSVPRRGPMTGMFLPSSTSTCSHADWPEREASQESRGGGGDTS